MNKPIAMLPSRKQCLEMLRAHDVPANVVAHSKTVTEVAVFIARKLREKGEKIDVALVEAAALLHDIARIKGSGMHHHELGFRILSPKWPSIAEIVRVHVPQFIIPPKKLPNAEAKIVFYADRRVVQGRVVSLDERYAYLRERYGKINGSIMRMLNSSEPPTRALEQEIFNKIDADISLRELANVDGKKQKMKEKRRSKGMKKAGERKMKKQERSKAAENAGDGCL